MRKMLQREVMEPGKLTLTKKSKKTKSTKKRKPKLKGKSY